MAVFIGIRATHFVAGCATVVNITASGLVHGGTYRLLLLVWGGHTNIHSNETSITWMGAQGSAHFFQRVLPPLPEGTYSVRVNVLDAAASKEDEALLAAVVKRLEWQKNPAAHCPERFGQEFWREHEGRGEVAASVMFDDGGDISESSNDDQFMDLDARLVLPTGISEKSGIASSRGIVLTYVGGSLDGTLFNIFVRSLRATGSRCKCVVITKDFRPSQYQKDFANQFQVEFVQAPEDLDVPTHTLEAGDMIHSLYRFFCWQHYMQLHGHLYDFVINSDYDVYFQMEPFQLFFGSTISEANSQQRHMEDKSSGEHHESLHVFAENPANLIGECPIHTRWYTDCEEMNGPRLLKAHADRQRICDGFTVGTARAHRAYLDLMVQELRRTKCIDQGIHNMLIWSNAFPDISVHVWDYWDGPVKHMDVGYIRDRYGRIINEQGLPYGVIHQFKLDRCPALLGQLLKTIETPSRILYENPSRVLLEDSRYPKCTIAACNGSRVHPTSYRMIERNMTKGFWGEIPYIHDLMQISGPLPWSVHSDAWGYRTVASLWRSRHSLNEGVHAGDAHVSRKQGALNPGGTVIVTDIVSGEDQGYLSDKYSDFWWFHSSNPHAFSIFDLDSLYTGSYFDDHVSPTTAALYVRWVALYFGLISSTSLRSVVEFGSAGGHFLYPLYLAGYDVIGVEGSRDGYHTILHQKKIPAEYVRRHDLRLPLNLNRRFDIALCTEVAEHIEPPFSSQLIFTLVQHSDVIWFSFQPPPSLHPNRNHVHHSNEMPLVFWSNLFAFYGYSHISLPKNVITDCGHKAGFIFYNRTAFPNVNVSKLEAGQYHGVSSPERDSIHRILRILRILESSSILVF